MRGFEGRRSRVVDRLGAGYAAGRLGEDSLELRIGRALAATSDEGLRMALWGLPDAQDLVRRSRAALDGLLGLSTVLLVADRPELCLRPAGERDSWTVGRGSGCDVAPTAISVSRRHARVDYRGGSWSVVDLGSANGTFVNGVRVSHQELRPGDVVSFASVVAELQRRR